MAGTVSLAEQQAGQPVNQQVPWQAHELVWPGHAALRTPDFPSSKIIIRVWRESVVPCLFILPVCIANDREAVFMSYSYGGTLGCREGSMRLRWPLGSSFDFLEQRVNVGGTAMPLLLASNTVVMAGVSNSYFGSMS